MKRLLPSMLALLVAGNFMARAQSDMIIKQRAKDLRNANDQQVQGAPGATPPSAPAPPPAPAPAPASPPTQAEIELKQNLEKLQTDLVAIQPGDTVPDDLKQDLQTDFATLAKTSVRPSATNLTKLANDLAAAFSAPGTTPREQGQLAQAINVVVNSSMYTAAQSQPFVVVAQTSLKSSRVADADVQTIVADLKTILAEVQKKKPKLYQ